MTLIEVLAALLLMGSILVALVTARGRLLSQHAHAADKQDAVRAADALLTSWWSTPAPGNIPGPGSGPGSGSGSGEIEGHPGWVWVVEEVQGVVPAGLDIRAVRLTIRDERDPMETRVLVEVDVLLPADNPAEVPSTGAMP